MDLRHILHVAGMCVCDEQDKTFGLKNKKGSKQQKFIQQVQHQVTQGGKTAKQVQLLTVLLPPTRHVEQSSNFQTV